MIANPQLLDRAGLPEFERIEVETAVSSTSE